jgi:hypothetical protein
MRRLLSVAGSVAAIGLISVATLVLFSTQAHPAPVGPQQPSAPIMQKGGGRVSWSPDHLVVTVAPGDTKTVQVTVTASGTVPATEAWVVPELAPYITVGPSGLPSMASGSDQSLSLILSVTTSMPFQTIEGTVHLRVGSSTVAKPLAITLTVWPKIESDGISFVRPPTWEAAVGPKEEGQRMILAVNSPSQAWILVEPDGGDAHDFPEDISITSSTVEVDGHLATRVNYVNVEGTIYISTVEFNTPLPHWPRFHIELRPAGDGTAEAVFEQVLKSLHVE